ncbi:glycosyltransferase, partial [Treponema pectinovorum]
MHTNFSATIGCYKNDNPEDFKTAFLSIYNQTVKPSEIIITVDGPIPPELNEYVQEFEDKYGAIVIRSEVNEGQGIAHAKAVLRCKYPLIALMDADDISVPDRFEKQLKIFENDPDIDIVGGYIKEFIDDCTNVVGVRIVPETDSQIKKYLKTRCPMNQVT